MPSEFAHIFVSGILGKTYTEGKMPSRFWVLTAVCSVLPDIDLLGNYLRVRYNGTFGHRGFTHSLTFALLASVLVVVLAFPAARRFSKKWWGLIAFFFVVTASHGVLDSMSARGMGVGFFIPFDNTRYSLPWRFPFASPVSISKFFSRDGLEVLIGEIIWIWLPMLLLYACVSLYRKRNQPRPRA
jgi:inner membrane protein